MSETTNTDKLLKWLTTLAPLVFQYGLPAVISMVQAFGKEEIGDAEIAELKAKARPPEEYFE